MANWITHERVADILLARGLDLDRTGFCVGNVAPDCNVENEDWTSFTPPREITHWMKGEKKTLEDSEDFFDQKVRRRRFSGEEEKAFLLGYYSHLVTDALFQRFLREERRVRESYERLKAIPAYGEKLAGRSETWETQKAVFGKRRVFQDIICQEWGYLKEHPESGYLTVLPRVRDFPDYLGIFPPGAIVRKLRLMPAMCQPCQPEERAVPEEGLLFFPREVYEGFLEETAEYVMDHYKKL